MTAWKTLLVPAAWLCVAFALEVSFVGFLLGGTLAWIVGSYSVAVGMTFALHPVTRGPFVLAVAFAVCATLAAQGIYFATNGEVSLARREIAAVALALPLLLLLVRRRSCDERDAWFRAHAKRVVPVALAVAVPALVGSVLGARSVDPARYERAIAVLGYNPFRALGDQPSATMPGLTEERLTRFLSPWSGVERPILDEVRQSCSGFIQNDPERATECADGLLRTRAASIRARRDDYRTLGLLSAVPWAIAGLFLWRGRRDRAGVHAGPAV